ncbi:MAG: 2-phosphoglycerate kinase [Actinomycetota bacterium]|nr:2-phosphoglycerate kinase [Actinomycetota bacterium]
MTSSERPGQVFVGEDEHSLPYSKGLATSSLMVTGLGPGRAYLVANKVEEELAELGVDRVSSTKLRSITRDVLRREAGERYADAYVKWQSVAKLQLPLIILIGGATGAGKSTIATQLATRLGITRVVSTDAVREVLRSAFTKEMFPTLYVSSFEADRAVRQPIPHSGDRLIIGFREQAAAVAVGAQALIDRAIEEGTDMILEGAHLVPGFLEGIDSDRAVVVPLVVTIEDEELHRSHFFRRSREARHRPEDRYLLGFKKIRRIQKYMVSSARVRGVPTISNFDLDATLSEIIDHVIQRALEMVERGTSVVETDQLFERTVEAVREKEGRATHETVS